MKILYLLPLLKNTGPANVVVSLVNGMENTADNIIVCTFLGIEDNYQNVFTNNKVTLIELNGFNLKSLVKLWKLIHHENVEILHSHGLLPDLASMVISLFSRTKSISTVHCNLSDNYKNEYQRPKGFVYFFLHKIALFFINKIIYVSSSIALSSRDLVIYNGIGKKESKVIASNSINLIFAGRLIPSKNIAFLLDCLAYINNQTSQKFTLHVYGDGALYPSLIKQEPANVIFYGFVDNYLENIPENSIFFCAKYSFVFRTIMCPIFNYFGFPGVPPTRVFQEVS